MPDDETAGAAEPPSPFEIHAILLEARNLVLRLRGNVDRVSSNAAFAIGLALAKLDIAKELVEQDIDASEKKSP
jgi:hypothetical protein